jgi:hypothetical protein
MKRLLLIFISIAVASAQTVPEIPELSLISNETKVEKIAGYDIKMDVASYKDEEGVEYSLGIFQPPPEKVKEVWEFFKLQKDEGEEETTFKNHDALAGVKSNFGYTISWKQDDFIIIIGALQDVSSAKDNVLALAEIVEGEIAKLAVTPTPTPTPDFGLLVALITFSLLALLRKKL